MLISEIDRKQALIEQYPKVDEWVRHKQNWEKMSLVGILEDYWSHISEMIEEEIKKGCGKLFEQKDDVGMTMCGKRPLCPECQIKLDVVQKDNE